MPCHTEHLLCLTVLRNAAFYLFYMAKVLSMFRNLLQIGVLIFPGIVFSQIEDMIDPEGLFINTFSGVNSGEEAVIVRSVDADNNLYSIANFDGDGQVVTIDSNGEISIDGAGVVGAFSDMDSAQFTLNNGLVTNVELQRVTLTDVNFLSFAGQILPVNPVYEDSWRISETILNARTGQVIRPPVIFETVFSAQIASDGTQRLLSSQAFNGQAGNSFQGIMRTQREYIVQAGTPGSSSELGLATLSDNFLTPLPANLVSLGRFIDINTFENIQFLETRIPGTTPLLNRGRIISQQILTRMTPLLAGDFNSNSAIDDSDRNQIVSLYGLTDQDIDYNLLADIDNDGLIDLRDSEAVDGGEILLMPINDGISGSWFNIDRSGEGWNIAILPGGQRAIVAFFSFSPNGESQVWIVGVGDIVNNEILFNDLDLTSGTVFGDAFDPNSVVRDRWGDLRVYFSDCNNGAISYRSDASFGHDARPIRRLTSLAGVDCQQPNSQPTVQDNQVSTGSWFAPERDGEGWLLEAIADNQVVLYWYTYDVTGGRQYWLGGVGEFDLVTNTIQFDTLNSFTGASFGDAFMSSDVSQVPWGSATFEQLDCGSGTFSFDSTITEFGSNSYDLIRLTSNNGIDCASDQFTP